MCPIKFRTIGFNGLIKECELFGEQRKTFISYNGLTKTFHKEKIKQIVYLSRSINVSYQFLPLLQKCTTFLQRGENEKDDFGQTPEVVDLHLFRALQEPDEVIFQEGS